MQYSHSHLLSCSPEEHEINEVGAQNGVHEVEAGRGLRGDPPVGSFRDSTLADPTDVEHSDPVIVSVTVQTKVSECDLLDMNLAATKLSRGNLSV
jgi:hypothetical protein